MRIFIRSHKSTFRNKGLFVILFLYALSSCSPVKYVPEDQYLLDRYSIKVREGKVKKDEIKNYVRQKPNKRVLGIRFHLGMYNLSNKDSDRGLSNWLRKIGEEPVIYDEFLAEKSVDYLKTYLNNKGYYNSIVKDTVQLKKKKARIQYNIEVYEPYKINSIKFNCTDSILAKDFFPDTINTVIKTGNNFDLDILEDERKRIEENLKNRGYYSFNKEFVFFQADSSAKNKEVDLVLNIHQAQQKDSNNNVHKIHHKKYKINKVYVFTNFDQKEALSLGDDYYKVIGGEKDVE